MEPAVSIVIPIHNDEEFLASALESCLAQTLANIEVICVDDCSTDQSVPIVERYLGDPRIRLLRHEVNSSAFQARRTGVEAARAPFILFLDSDDELSPEVARIPLKLASRSGADLVGFGVEIVTSGGDGAPRFEESLQPVHTELIGSAILPALFPVGATAQGHLWRYLFRTELLLEAYSGLPRDLTLFRANDLPIAFLAVAAANKYVATKRKLYRYFFRRGKSGRAIANFDDFQHRLGAIDSIESIKEVAENTAVRAEFPDVVRDCYSSARLSIIGNVLRYCVQSTPGAIQMECLDRLQARVGALDVIRAASDHCREAVSVLSRQSATRPIRRAGNVARVLLMTHNLGPGGVQAVVAAQAHYLISAGLTVTIALHTSREIAQELPCGVRVIEIAGSTSSQKLKDLVAICNNLEVEKIIDHHILYDETWPLSALAAKTVGVPTIGWIHNFALRPLFDGTTRTAFLLNNLAVLEQVVVLSPTDVSFWKLRGIENVVYLPNPPSPILIDLPIRTVPREHPKSCIELVWWGRLQQSTKQVSELVKVAAELRKRDVEFRLAIIGPDSNDMNAGKLRQAAEGLGVADAINLPGPMSGSELINALSEADVAIMTSAIEGYPLSLVEAQFLGLPVVMYELPWLSFLADNAGVVTVPQGAAEALADEIIRLVEPNCYSRASEAALSAARRMGDLKFGELYRSLLDSRLPADYSPQPTHADAALLLRVGNAFADRNTRALRRAQSRIRLLESQLHELRRTESQGVRRASTRARRARPDGSPKADRVAHKPVVPKPLQPDSD